jgi:dehydrogenase/reductase SDR family member 7B
LDKPFFGKTIWITGASSGIGEQLAITFGKQGCKLILSSRNVEALQNVALLCKEASSVELVPLDLSKIEDLSNIAQKVLAKAQRIDVLILNGGISQRGLAVETPISVDEYIVRVNLLGNIALAKAVLPSMIKHQLGHIAVVTSVTGKFGTKFRSAYAASKHGLHGFFESLRAEVFKENVHITMICPGFVRTNISLNALTAKGTPQGVMDKATDEGLSPHIVASRILNAIALKKEEVIIAGARERLGVWLQRLWPVKLRKMLRNAEVT